LESLLNVLDVGHESLEKWYKEQKSAELDIATNMTVQ
jgi:hypothetical protein